MNTRRSSRRRTLSAKAQSGSDKRPCLGQAPVLPPLLPTLPTLALMSDEDLELPSPTSPLMLDPISRILGMATSDDDFLPVVLLELLPMTPPEPHTDSRSPSPELSLPSPTFRATTRLAPVPAKKTHAHMEQHFANSTFIVLLQGAAPPAPDTAEWIDTAPLPALLPPTDLSAYLAEEALGEPVPTAPWHRSWHRPLEYRQGERVNLALAGEEQLPTLPAMNRRAVLSGRAFNAMLLPSVGLSELEV